MDSASSGSGGARLEAVSAPAKNHMHHSFLKISLPLHLPTENDLAPYGSTTVNGPSPGASLELRAENVLPEEDDSPGSETCTSGENCRSDGESGSQSEGATEPPPDCPAPESSSRDPQFLRPIERHHDTRRQSMPSLFAKLCGQGFEICEDDDGFTPQQRRELAQIDHAADAVREALIARGLLDPQLCAAKISTQQHRHMHQQQHGLGFTSWHTHSLPQPRLQSPAPAAGPLRASALQLPDCLPRASSPVPVHSGEVAGAPGGAEGVLSPGGAKGASRGSFAHTTGSAPNSPMAAAALRRRQLMQAAAAANGAGALLTRSTLPPAAGCTVSDWQQRSPCWRRNSVAGSISSVAAASNADSLVVGNVHGGAGGGRRSVGGGQGAGLRSPAGSSSPSLHSVLTTTMMCGAELLCPRARAGVGTGGGGGAAAVNEWEENLWEDDGSEGVADLGTLVRSERKRLADVQSKVTGELRFQRRYQGLLTGRSSGPSTSSASSPAAPVPCLTAEELTASVIPVAARPPPGVELKVPPDDIRFSGIKLRFLVGLLEALDQHPGLCGSTSELVSRLVVPLTAEHRCRLLDLIPATHRGQPHHYICHAWGASARDLLATLRKEMLPPPPPPAPPPTTTVTTLRAQAGNPSGTGTGTAAGTTATATGRGAGGAARGSGLTGSGGGSCSRWDAGGAFGGAVATAAAAVAAAAGRGVSMSHPLLGSGEEPDRASSSSPGWGDAALGGAPGSGGRVRGGLALGAHLPHLPAAAAASPLASAPGPAGRPSSGLAMAAVIALHDADAGADRGSFLPSIAANAGSGGGAAGGGAGGAKGALPGVPEAEAASGAAGQCCTGSEAGGGSWEQQERAQEAWQRLQETYKEDLERALDQVVWIDLVCVNQHSAVKKDYGKIARTVVSCGATVLVLDPELTALGRTWCLFEIMNCLRCKRHLKVFRAATQEVEHQQPHHHHNHRHYQHHKPQPAPPQGPVSSSSPPCGTRQLPPHPGAGARGRRGEGGGASGGHDKGAGKAAAAAASAAGAASGSLLVRGGVGGGFGSDADRRWDRAVESISMADSRASCEADRVGILQEVLSTVGIPYVDEMVRSALRLSNNERAAQLGLRRQQLRTTLELLQPDPAVIGTEEYESNLARCREHLTAVLQQHYPEELLHCIIPSDYVSDSARCWDMLGIFAAVLDREQFREDAKVLRSMAWLIFKRHSKRYIDVLYEKELESWLVNSLERDRKWRRTQAKLQHDAQKKWKAG